MSVARITWQDLQQARTDGKRWEAIAGEIDLEEVFRRG
jgi:hypothetical protein